DFAPVADVNSNVLNPVIADRSFGSDPDLVSRHVVAFIEGLQEEGVGATLKHFPGHGDTDVDSHLALPTVRRPLSDLRKVELRPFQAGIRAGVAAVMSAHIVLPTLDAQRPATLSEAALAGLLREELGFDGVIVTDALDMRAISDRWPAPVAAVMSLQAGADMPLVIGTVAEHRETLAAIDEAGAASRLDLSGPRRRIAVGARAARGVGGGGGRRPAGGGRGGGGGGGWGAGRGGGGGAGPRRRRRGRAAGGAGAGAGGQLVGVSGRCAWCGPLEGNQGYS